MRLFVWFCLFIYFILAQPYLQWTCNSDGTKGIILADTFKLVGLCQDPKIQIRKRKQ